DGLALLSEVKKVAPWLPVIVMTSYAEIPMAVQAVKAGAFDFIEKPLESESFLRLVGRGLTLNDPADLGVGKPLTKTEKIVLQLILRGMANKGIAYTLQRSERTIEVHRSRIMRKLDVDNVVDLVKRASSMGLGDTR
ncbi:MAG: response regulator, partial [Phycisphaerales bacterium]